MRKYIFILFFALSTSFAHGLAATTCVQVEQDAKNSSTGECMTFPTPCDVPEGWEQVTSCDLEDNQIIDLDNQNEVKELSVNFNVKTFSSCQNYEDVMKKFINDYYKFHPIRPYMMYDDVMLDGMDADVGAVAPNTQEKSISSETMGGDKGGAENFSDTNIQVKGVDESDIIKTDGKYIYYYNSKTKAIHLMQAYPGNELKLIRKINLPSSFYSPELFLGNGKLVILATKYSNYNYSYYWFERGTKTVLISYDVSDVEKLRIDKYYQVDGSYSKSRKIGDYVYILSQSNFSFPYNTYYRSINGAEDMVLDKGSLEQDFDAKKVLPKKAELRRTDDESEHNVVIRGKKVPYNISSNYVSKCADIEYVIPDEETMKKFDFTPSYVTLSIINVANPKEEIKTKLLFGDVSETHMSLDNLYITSNLYTSYDFKCPQIQCITTPCVQPRCNFPFYYRGENTLIHKISIDGFNANYKTTTIVPGYPLNQYSMDESGGNFRIVTSSIYPKRATNVYVLNNQLNLTGKLEGLAPGEDFKSARFMGDKLYLVTFEQIDPLFVISLADSNNPKILGELKIPGYSTYLHPYDENHLIGLGYDTEENQWGGVTNGGLKVDLYDISDITNPLQKYSLTLGGKGSSSEALSNPRMFVFNNETKTLFLPATIYEREEGVTDYNRYKDAFQGSYAIKIDKDSGIKELSKVTHIDMSGLEEQRQEECKKYTETTESKCEKLIGGGEYCPSVYRYVPPYCYESSTTVEYFANKIWNFRDSFVTRNLYLDNYWYTISNSKVQVNDINSNYSKITSIDLQ